MKDFNIGQKVVCVDDFFAPEIAMLYDALPLEGVVYVIRAIHEGNNYDDGKAQKVIVLLLVGIVNQAPAKPGGKERGFNSKRFRDLEELKDESKQSELELVETEKARNRELQKA